MFTGIAKELGIVHRMEKNSGPYALAVDAKVVSGASGIGDSVCVNGACLTVVKIQRTILSFDVMAETAQGTTLGGLKMQDKVNLEPSLRAGDLLGGHLVTGHIDCVGSIKDITASKGAVSVEVGVPAERMHLVVLKGSVALDGISLTVGGIKEGSFLVHLIPHTLAVTTLGAKKRGDAVNVEFDIIGKYVARIMALSPNASVMKEVKTASRITESYLKDKGFSNG